MDIEIEDDVGFNFSGKDKRSFKSIILSHYENCIKEMSKEQITGGVMKRIVNNEVIEGIAPNQVEITINSIDSMKRALYEEINKQPDIAENANKFEKQLIILKKLYMKKRNNIMNNFSRLSNISHPEKEEFSERDIYRVSFRKSLSKLEENYQYKLLDIHKEILFPLLVKLLDRRNYLEDKAVI